MPVYGDGISSDDFTAGGTTVGGSSSVAVGSGLVTDVDKEVHSGGSRGSG